MLCKACQPAGGSAGTWACLMCVSLVSMNMLARGPDDELGGLGYLVHQTVSTVMPFTCGTGPGDRLVPPCKGLLKSLHRP